METPLVTIYTTTRNRGCLIARCINSILSQTYTNFEHIILDGASTDNTEEVVKSYNDPRIRYFKMDEAHSSTRNCWNFAKKEIRGKYLCFLDDDDEYLPTKIEKQVNLFESLPEDYGLVYCWMSYFDTSNNNKYIKIHNPQLRGFVRDEVVAEPSITGTPTLMFRFDFYKDSISGKVGIEKTGIASDWAMCAYACQITKVDYVPESLVNVYVNHGCVRQSESNKYYKDASRKQIQFHRYFLTTYKDIFKRIPKYAVYHYYCIAVSYFHMKEYGGFITNILKAFWRNPSYTIKRLTKKQDDTRY